MTGTYNEKRLPRREEKAEPRALAREIMYDICGSAVFTLLFALAFWGGVVILDRLLMLISF
jgi:hypothetical protein